MLTLNQLFYKFQQYRMLFDEVIKSSGLYGEALQEIKVCTLVGLLTLCFFLFLKAMYDNYVARLIANISEESQWQPIGLYHSSDIEKLRDRVNRLENDVTTLIADNAR